MYGNDISTQSKGDDFPPKGMGSCCLARPRNAYYPFPDGYLLKKFGPRRSRKQLSLTF